MNEYLKEQLEAVIELNALADRNDFPYNLRFILKTDGYDSLICLGEEFVLYDSDNSDLHYEVEGENEEIETKFYTVLEFCRREFNKLKQSVQSLKLK